jgi:hypothetical protein
MSGLKYVKDFEFPKAFGFSGSATDSNRVAVKSYDRAKPKFAKGGPGKGRSDKRDSPSKPSPPPPPPPSSPRTLPRISVVDALRGKTREQREKELGLKAGGRAGKRYAKGGPVYSKDLNAGSSSERRTAPSNNMNQQTGGKTPLRPGFAKGGPLKTAKHATGGPVTAARGGDVAQDRRMIDRAISRHVEAPKPKGHGVKGGKMRGGRADC